MNTWTTNGPPFSALQLMVDPGLPAVVYTESGRTTDGGLTWQLYSLDNQPGNSVAAGPPGTVYVGTVVHLGPLFKSLDAGATWTSIPFADGFTNTYLLRVDPAARTLYAATATKDNPNQPIRNSLEKSEDGGATWSSCGYGNSLAALTIDPTDSSTLYLDGYKSTDGCATWRPLSEFPQSASDIVVDFKTPRIVYVATDTGVFRSTDGGESFAPINTGLTTLHVAALVIDPKDPKRLYAGTQGGGVFASADAGLSWEAMNDGLTDLEVHALAIDPCGTSLHAATTSGVFDFHVVSDPDLLWPGCGVARPQPLRLLTRPFDPIEPRRP